MTTFWLGVIVGLVVGPIWYHVLLVRRVMKNVRELQAEARANLRNVDKLLEDARTRLVGRG